MEAFRAGQSNQDSLDDGCAIVAVVQGMADERSAALADFSGVAKLGGTYEGPPALP